MLHAENTVSALKKWDIPKSTHDVIFDWCEYPKPQITGYLQIRCLNIQRDSIMIEPVLANANFTPIPIKIRAGEESLKRIGISDDLKMTECIG